MLRRQIDPTFDSLLAFYSTPGNLRWLGNLETETKEQAELLAEVEGIVRATFGNSYWDAYQSISNLLMNLTILREKPDALSQTTLIADIAVLIGAGPSLNHQIAEIRKLTETGKVFILASDATLKRLLSEGIRPSAVLTSERPRETMHLFENLPETAKPIPLIANMISHPMTLRTWPNDLILFFGRCQEDVAWLDLPNQTTLQSNPFVMQCMTAFCLAKGVKEIHYYGMDLTCSPSNVSHASLDHGMFREWDQPRSDEEMLKKGYIRSSQGLFTDVHWQSFARDLLQMEQAYSKQGVRFVTHSKGLLKDGGMEYSEVLPEVKGAKEVVFQAQVARYFDPMEDLPKLREKIHGLKAELETFELNLENFEQQLIGTKHLFRACFYLFLPEFIELQAARFGERQGLKPLEGIKQARSRTAAAEDGLVSIMQQVKHDMLLLLSGIHV